MRFQVKALIQWMVSALPFSHRLNSFLRKNGTKELDSEEHFNAKLNLANSYLALLNEYSELEKPSSILDFGAGYDLIIPIFFSDYCDKIIAFDIKKNAESELVSIALKKIKQVNTPLNKVWPFLTENLGIDYKVARSLSSIELPEKLDLILSTVVFEYLSEDAIKKTLSVFRQAISPEGLVILTVNYRDHWAHSDSSISDYNFLKYSKKGWKKFCPSQCEQNRLRNSDYIELILDCGFEILQLDVINGSASEIDRLSIHFDFTHYKTEDLLIKEALFVLRKAKN